MKKIVYVMWDGDGYEVHLDLATHDPTSIYCYRGNRPNPRRVFWDDLSEQLQDRINNKIANLPRDGKSNCT